MAKLTMGCGTNCRVSQITDEILVCGESKINNKLFLCDSCVEGLNLQAYDLPGEDN